MELSEHLLSDAPRRPDDARLRTPEQQDSSLLFPSLTGGFRARNVLDKPFRRVRDAIDLPYLITAKGMRRTFQDLTRAARVDDVVTRSISGHLTEEMQVHYSSVLQEEQRVSIAKVIELFGPRQGDENARTENAQQSPAITEQSPKRKTG